MKTIFLMILGYLLGSIPNALWIGKVFLGKDVREHGSKNTGATNAARVLGIKYGILTLVLDVLKGAIPTYLALKYGDLMSDSLNNGILVGIISILGHTFSIFLKFRGGKAVATTLGVFVVLTPLGILFTALIFFITFFIFKYVSLASIMSAVFLPIFIALLYKNNTLTLFATIIGTLIVIRHKSNIEKIKNNTETKFQFNKKNSL